MNAPDKAALALAFKQLKMQNESARRRLFNKQVEPLRYDENKPCTSCGGKMIVYYNPYCPNCTPKEKIRKNLIKSIYYIDHKYGIDTNDYGATKAGIKSSISFNAKHKKDWLDRFAPFPEEYTINPLKGRSLNKQGLDWLESPKSRKFFAAREAAYQVAPDGLAKEIPGLIWWHTLLDMYQFSNDCRIKINWQDVYDNCKEDWEREIAQFFVDEFGKNDIFIKISW